MVTVVEHHIQRDIIARLAKADSLRFSELKPKMVENNSFMYHMKNLQSLGLVMQQVDKSYSLTMQGLTYIDSLTWTNRKPRKQPKLLCIMALQNSAGEYLLAFRKMQPTIHTWMLPSGKQHFGEAISDHVNRELHEQIGVGLDMSRRGILEILIRRNNELVTHIVGHVYSAQYDGDSPLDNDEFHYEWWLPNQAKPLTPGTHELITALQTQDNFLISLDVQAD